MNARATEITVTRVATAAIPVTDQDRALEFYTGELGLEVRRDAAMPSGARWIEVSPQASVGTTIALVRATAEAPAGVETGIRLVVGDADGLHTELEARGIEADDVLRWPGVPVMFAFRDPDGNRLVIIEDLTA